MTPTIFVWRKSKDEYVRYFSYAESCPFCTTTLVDGSDRPDVSPDLDHYDFVFSCRLCGWWQGYQTPIFDPHSNIHAQVFDSHVTTPVLKEFDLNASGLELSELGAHLKRRYKDIYGLSWERFEELIGDVFRQQNFFAVHTQLSWDGGADLLLYTNGDLWAIVECKKYAKHRTVGIETLRALVGACVDWNIGRASLVTSANISSVVVRKAQDFRASGFEIDLIDASRLLRMLEVYNKELPPLELLSEGDRHAIVRGEIKTLAPNIPATIKIPHGRSSAMVVRDRPRPEGSFVPKGQTLLKIQLTEDTGTTSLESLPAPADGMLDELLVEEGAPLSTGQAVARMRFFSR